MRTIQESQLPLSFDYGETTSAKSALSHSVSPLVETEKNILVYPALLFRKRPKIKKLEEFVKNARHAGAEGIHLDIIDGSFENDDQETPTQTVFDSIEDIKILVNICHKYGMQLDVHLMVANPECILPSLFEINVDYVSFHCEYICKRIDDISFENDLSFEDKIKCLKEKHSNTKIGIAINPSTKFLFIIQQRVIAVLDFFLIMSVVPGKQGGEFVNTSGKIRLIKPLYPNKQIFVDGAMNKENASIMRDAGADVIISGSFYNKSKNPEKAIKELKGID